MDESIEVEERVNVEVREGRELFLEGGGGWEWRLGEKEMWES